jgi:hypothetical protein
VLKKDWMGVGSVSMEHSDSASCSIDCQCGDYEIFVHLLETFDPWNWNKSARLSRRTTATVANQLLVVSR